MKTLLLITFLVLYTSGRTQSNTYSKIVYIDNADISTNAITPADSGNTLMVGIHNYTNGIVSLIDSLGNGIWSKTYIGNVELDQVLKTKDSSYLISGSVYNPVLTMRSAYFLKIDMNGDTLWTKTMHSGAFEYNNSVIVESSDSVYTVAWTHQNSPEINICQLDAQGNIVWAKNFMGNDFTMVTAIEQLPDSSFVISGYLGNSNGFLMNISTTGQIIWTKELPSSIADDLEIVSEGMIVLFKNMNTGNVGTGKFNFSGINLWMQDYPGLYHYSFDRSNVLGQMEDSTFTLITTGDAISGSYESYVVKFDSVGIVTNAISLMMPGADFAPAKNKGILAIGNGPIYGIKSSIISSLHTGVIKLDSLLTTTDCYYPYNVSSAPLNILADSSITYIESGIISQFNIPITLGSVVILDSMRCVEFLGGLNEYSNNLNIRIFPNVSSGVFNFEQETNSEVSVLIYNVNGKEIYNAEHNTTSFSVDLSSNSTGFYFYKIVDSDLKSAMGKLVLE